MADALQIDIESLPSLRIFRLTGPFTLNEIFDFQDTARTDTERSILIDLSGVPYMDSAGLGALLGVMASCERTGRKFAITGASHRIQTLLQVSKVDNLVPSFESVEAAQTAIAQTASA
jgi:anti-sigma B factor antagonist